MNRHLESNITIPNVNSALSPNHNSGTRRRSLFEKFPQFISNDIITVIIISDFLCFTNLAIEKKKFSQP
jgi:hypothetical protein